MDPTRAQRAAITTRGALQGAVARRVGIVRAAADRSAVLVVLGSWCAWAQGRHGLGVCLARAGATLLVVGGFPGRYTGRGRVDRFQGGAPRRARGPVGLPCEQRADQFDESGPGLSPHGRP